MNERNVLQLGWKDEGRARVAEEMEVKRRRVDPVVRQGDVFAEVLVEAVAPSGGIV